MNIAKTGGMFCALRLGVLGTEGVDGATNLTLTTTVTGRNRAAA